MTNIGREPSIHTASFSRRCVLHFGRHRVPFSRLVTYTATPADLNTHTHTPTHPQTDLAPSLYFFLLTIVICGIIFQWFFYGSHETTREQQRRGRWRSFDGKQDAHAKQKLLFSWHSLSLKLTICTIQVVYIVQLSLHMYIVQDSVDLPRSQRPESLQKVSHFSRFHSFSFISSWSPCVSHDITLNPLSLSVVGAATVVADARFDFHRRPQQQQRFLPGWLAGLLTTTDVLLGLRTDSLGWTQSASALFANVEATTPRLLANDTSLLWWFSLN